MPHSTHQQFAQHHLGLSVYCIGVWQQESGKGPRLANGAAYCVPLTSHPWPLGSRLLQTRPRENQVWVASDLCAGRSMKEVGELWRQHKSRHDQVVPSSPSHPPPPRRDNSSESNAPSNTHGHLDLIDRCIVSHRLVSRLTEEHGSQPRVLIVVRSRPQRQGQRPDPAKRVGSGLRSRSLLSAAIVS